VGFTLVYFEIPPQSWNFVGRKPGHSKSIVEFLFGWVEYRTFGETLTFAEQSQTAIYGFSIS